MLPVAVSRPMRAKPNTTVRGTPRQRLPKGFTQDLRRQVLKDLPLEQLEVMLQRKLKRMSEDRRLEVEEQLRLGDRRELVLNMLSQ